MLLVGLSIEIQVKQEKYFEGVKTFISVFLERTAYMIIILVYIAQAIIFVCHLLINSCQCISITLFNESSGLKSKHLEFFFGIYFFLKRFFCPQDMIGLLRSNLGIFSIAKVWCCLGFYIDLPGVVIWQHIHPSTLHSF